MKDFVEDKFFSKGHYFLKFCQTFLSIFTWLFVFSPIMITVKLLTTDNENLLLIPEGYHLQEIKIFQDVSKILMYSLLSCLIACILLTIKNNFKIKNQFKKEITYDAVNLEKKIKLVEDHYTQQFNSKEIRQSEQFYSVQADQNLEADFIKHLFKGRGIS